MQDGVYYAGLADAANQIALNVSYSHKMSGPFFFEGSAKIWVDKRIRTEIGQESSHQLVILVDSLVHIRGKVLFIGVCVLILDAEKRGKCNELVEHVRFTLTLSNSAT